MARQEVRGGAAKCTLHSNILSDELSIVLDGDVSGWPTGASSRNFEVTLERGTTKMEKILCSALTGQTLTVVTRGYDGTSAKTHNSGVPAEHGLSASLLDDFGRHVYDTTSDDHTQYVPRTGARAMTARGAAFGTPVSVGTANAAGTATTWAGSDHVHDIADGAIDHAGLFAAAVVDEAALAASVAGGGLTGGAATPLAVNVDGSTIEIASDAIRLKDAGITLAKLAAAIRPVTICTSGTRPGSPAVGDRIFETDTGKELTYQSVTTGWTPPWNTAWGVQGEGTKTSSTDFTTLADMGSMQVSFTSVANRKLVVVIDGQGADTGGVGTSAITIATGTSGAGTTVVSRQVGSSGASQENRLIHIETPTQVSVAGTTSYHARCERNGGAGAFRDSASATNPWTIRVVDLGPNAAPA